MKHQLSRVSEKKRGEEEASNVVADDIAVRDTTKLYASSTTVACAHKCIPCGYKVGLFDVTQDKDFCKQVSNQRPEQCPRSRSTACEDGTLGFHCGMKVLTVGDGDFSFSLAVARVLRPRDNARSEVVATSYESKETLTSVYPGFNETVKELDDLGVSVFYNVDATALEETLPGSMTRHKHSFHRICWNFPCTAIAKGQDGQNQEMDHNKELVRKFVGNAREWLHVGDGEIQICHKTKPPYNQWKIEDIALENIKEDDKFQMYFVGRIVLDRFLLPPYAPRKAKDRKSFPCHDACVFIFAQTSASEGSNTSGFQFQPTIAHVHEKDEGQFRGGAVQPVSTKIILGIRQSLLSTKQKAPKRQKQRR